jgi:hypothetical protein
VLILHVCVYITGERERWRERERERERHTETQRHRDTETQTDRQTDRRTDRQTVRQREREKERKKERKKERQRERLVFEGGVDIFIILSLLEIVLELFRDCFDGNLVCLRCFHDIVARLFCLTLILLSC